MDMSTKPLTQEELRQRSRDTRDSVKGKNNYQPGGLPVTDIPYEVQNFQELDYKSKQFNERYN